MIQFNLLPDVKLAYIKATKQKRLVISISTLVTIVCLVVLVLMFVLVNVLQKGHLNDLSNDITAKSKDLAETDDLDKILTVQNQLLVLDQLHNDKPVASRLFTYISQVTPSEINLTKLDFNFEDKTMKFTGSSTSLNNVNKFADTLKFTDFTVGDSSDKQKAFSNVVLSSFGRNDDTASFSIDLTFDQKIFDGAEEVKLVVPSTVTTRSETEKPLFKAPTEEGSQ
jgi:Tfp pilus assembly protein PilN